MSGWGRKGLSEGSKHENLRIHSSALCVWMCVSKWTCRCLNTLTRAWAAFLWSRWLSACFSFSSRSACRAAQRDVNPLCSSSRVCTTCCSFSSFLLHSIFISYIRRRVGGHGGQINNDDTGGEIDKVIDLEWKNTKTNEMTKRKWKNNPLDWG